MPSATRAVCRSVSPCIAAVSVPLLVGQAHSRLKAAAERTRGINFVSLKMGAAGYYKDSRFPKPWGRRDVYQKTPMTR